MDWGDVPTWVGGAAGIAGGYYGWRANKNAKVTNGIAEEAKDSAAESVVIANEANTIAQNANDLARDANAIAERARAHTADHVQYHWTVDIDDEGLAVVLNDSSNPALEVSVFIRADQDMINARALDHVGPFEKLEFNVSGAMQEHLEEVRQHPFRPGGSSSHSGVFSVTGSRNGDIIEKLFRVDVRWQTQSGVLRSDSVEKVVRHQMKKSGLTRLD